MCKKNTITGFVLSMLFFASMCHASYTITIKTDSILLDSQDLSYSRYISSRLYPSLDKICSESADGRVPTALYSGGVRVTTRTTWDNGKTDEWTQWEGICNDATYNIQLLSGRVSCWIYSSADSGACGILPVKLGLYDAIALKGGGMTIQARTLTATRPRLGRNIVSTNVKAYILLFAPSGASFERQLTTTTSVRYTVETPDITLPATVPATCVRGGASVAGRPPEESERFDITIRNLETPPTIEFVPQIPDKMTGVKVIFHDTLFPQSAGALKAGPVENGSVRRTGYFELQCGDLPAGQYEIPVTMNVSVD